MNSVLSFPERGPYGKSSWRGNTSGYVLKELFEHFRPQTVADLCEGSGTTGDVCKEMGIDYVGLDLFKGNDFTKDYALKAIGHECDLTFSHFPYHDMIAYSGQVWGDKKIDGDTSHCKTPEEFLEKSYVGLLNQREATKVGGIYATLIGDHRAKGEFRSYQADFIQMMPKDELVSVTIKLQHNAMSFGTQYKGHFVPILHEYLLVWKKTAKGLFQIAWDAGVETKRKLAQTWRSVVRIALMRLNGRAKLSDIYAEVESVAGHKIANNVNYKAKVRQTLQKHFESVERGVWGVAA